MTRYQCEKIMKELNYNFKKHVAKLKKITRKLKKAVNRMNNTINNNI